MRLLVLLLLSAPLCFGEPKNPAPPPVLLDPAEGERQARALVATLLAQKPTQNATNTSVVRIRGTDRKWREIPTTCSIVATPTNFLSIYEVPPSTDRPGGMTLTIIHSDDRTNQYLLSEPADAPPKKLTQEQLMTPFAGSDFWVADLGLEFLHWPQQRVLKKEMRSTQFCDVLESINPHPVPGGYVRVLSWIGINHPDETVVVHADAFDDHSKRLKQFAPKNLEKINGAYQLESMEMRNDQTGSRTIIEFNLGDK